MGGLPLLGQTRSPLTPAEREALLAQIATVSERVMAAEVERDELIFDAIQKGCSEREIGKAAGMSGPAVHYRKMALQAGERMRP